MGKLVLIGIVIGAVVVGSLIGITFFGVPSFMNTDDSSVKNTDDSSFKLADIEKNVEPQAGSVEKTTKEPELILTSNSFPIKKSQTKGNIKVTLHEVEYLDKYAKVLVEIENLHTSHEIFVYPYQSRLVEEKTQYTSYLPPSNSGLPTLESEIPHEIVEKGYIFYEVPPKGPFIFFMEGMEWMGMGYNEYEFEIFVDSAATTKVYENQGHGFSIEYPESWYVLDKIYRDGDLFDIVTITDKFVSRDELVTYNTKIDVLVIRNSPPLGVQDSAALDFLMEKHRNNCNSEFYFEFGYSCKDFTPNDSEIIFMDNLKAYQTSYSWTKTLSNGDEFDLTTWHTVLYDGNHNWFITAKTTTEKLLMYEGLLKSSIESFNLLEN